MPNDYICCVYESTTMIIRHLISEGDEIIEQLNHGQDHGKDSISFYSWTQQEWLDEELDHIDRVAVFRVFWHCNAPTH